MGRRMNRQIVSALLSLVFAPLAAASGWAADPDSGRALARHVCAVCHVVAAGQPKATPDAPAFAKIARSPKFRARGAAFVLERHPRMPNLALTLEQGEDVAAYIRTLRH